MTFPIAPRVQRKNPRFGRRRRQCSVASRNAAPKAPCCTTATAPAGNPIRVSWVRGRARSKGACKRASKNAAKDQMRRSLPRLGQANVGAVCNTGVAIDDCGGCGQKTRRSNKVGCLRMRLKSGGGSFVADAGGQRECCGDALSRRRRRRSLPRIRLGAPRGYMLGRPGRRE